MERDEEPQFRENRPMWVRNLEEDQWEIGVFMYINEDGKFVDHRGDVWNIAVPVKCRDLM
jgi:hypothetical protein